MFGIMLVVVALPAMAQTPGDIDRASRESERIQREQRLRQQEDQQRSLENRRAPARLEMPAPEMPQGKGDGCHVITSILITGGINMPDPDKEDVIRPFLGECLGADEIQTILSEITRYYIEHGYATTRVYLPAQDLSSGTLKVDVIEGRVGRVEQPEGGSGSFSKVTAFPGVEGEVLNLRDFEQGLDQINRLQSNNATLDIAPGQEEGESNITIRNEPTKRWHANLTGDNYGTRGTGRNQVGATASYDNLFRINDFISLTHRKTLPINQSSRQSSSTSALMSVPFGYATLTGGYSYSNYDSSLQTPAARLHLNGDNRAVFGTIDYVAYRDQVNKVTLSGTLTEKKSRNYIAGQKLTVSSRSLTVADLGAALSTNVLGGSTLVNLGYSRGLKILGALQDTPGQDGDLPTAQFDRYVFNASWSRPFTVAEKDFTWSSQLTGQAARDTLYGSEQISIGGIYSVRGFHEETLANDDGYYIRNDLTLRENLGTVYGQEVFVNPYIALDAGAVTGRAPDTPHGMLVGGAVGASMSMGPANADLFAGHSIKSPDGMGEEGWTTFGRLAVSF